MVRAASTGPLEVRGRVKRTDMPVCCGQLASNAGPTQKPTLNVALLKAQRPNLLLDHVLTAF